MIAVSFLDALAGDDGITANADPQRNGEVASLATKYVGSMLDDWQRVLECEHQFGATKFRSPADKSRVNQSLYQVYQKWAAEAEQVLLRTRQLSRSGRVIENAEALEHAFGHVQARLKMTPEMFDRAREQIRQGQCIPMEELRDGLRARLRT